MLHNCCNTAVLGVLLIYPHSLLGAVRPWELCVYRTWENFGGGKYWRINGSKVFGEKKFGESVGSLLKTLAFINIGGENFGELPTVCQIRQNFPPPKFSHVRYISQTPNGLITIY